MTRPSPAPRKRTTRPYAPILTTVETCASCNKRLPAKRKDNDYIAAGVFCPVCDKAICTKCFKKPKHFDEESPYAQHLREDEGYARNRAFDELQFDIDDHERTFSAIEHVVDDRVAVMTHAAHPIESMKRMLALSRGRKDIAPLAYAQDRMVMARLMILYLRGEFDEPREGITLVHGFETALVDSLMHRSIPVPGQDYRPARESARGSAINPARPVIISPAPALTMDDRYDVASPATLKKPITLYVGTTDPGAPVKGDL